MASPEEGKKYILKTKDGEEFKVDKAAALMSVTISNMIELGCDENPIRLFNVDGKIFSLVEEYLNKHAEMEKKKSLVGNRGGKSAVVDKEIKAWDAEFMRKVDTDTLYHLLLAANYLEILSLLDLAAETTANIMKGKNPEEIRQIFGIPNDFTEMDMDMWVFK